jgi:hypothetical protein
MSLAKHHFARLRAFHICCTCLSNALAVWCCEVINPTWCLKFCSKSVVICCSSLLVVMACSLLAFSSWFSSWACPSPPGLAADHLSFSSWAWSWASIHPHGFARCFLVFKWCCARAYDVLGDISCWSNGSCFPWWYSSSRLLGLQAGVVLPAPTSQSCDWAACVLCACVLHSAWSHPALVVLWNCYALWCFVPPVIKRTDTSLGH